MFFAWIIFGPTASGKSARAIALAKEKGADILSFDSRQIYKGMATLTGQDVPEGFSQTADGTFSLSGERTLFGLNMIEPNQPFSIRHYYEFAQPIIESHRKTNTPLILVGGSWPYAQVLIDPPATLYSEVDQDLRQKLMEKPVEELQTKLQEINPARWKIMNASDQNNPRRLVRAIETTNQTPDSAQPLLNHDEYSIILHELPLEELEKNIEIRIKKRLDQGVLKEIKDLMNRFSDWNSLAFTSTGSKYLRQHLEGKISLEETQQLWFFQERQYAKRQITWLKKLASEKRYNIST